MSLPQEEADRLLRLLCRHWDDPQGNLELVAIEEILAAYGVEAADLVMRFSAVHVDLETLVASSQACDLAIECIQREQQARAACRPSAIVSNATTFQPGSAARRRNWAVLAIAGAILLAVGLSTWLTPDLAKDDSHQAAVPALTLVRPPQTVACVTRLTNAAWAEGSALRVGQPLKENDQLELLRGSAQFSMASGADIVLEAPCRITLMADDFVFLERGLLTAQVAKWATGFVVDTKGLRVTDLGTRFGVSAASSGVAEAHVLEGEVLAEPLKAQRPKRTSLLLSEGEAIRVDLAQATIDQIIARSDWFVRSLQQFRPFRPIQIFNTGVGKQPGDPDAHWRVTAGAPSYGPYPQPAIVTRGDPSYLDNKADASQWISIREEARHGVPTATTHTFETTFDLTGYDLSTIRIIGSFLVDDGITELRINGRPVTFEKWMTTWDVYDFQRFHTIEILEGFVPGKNVISIDVYNSPSHPSDPQRPNPMGLRVEWQAFGCEAASEAVPASIADVAAIAQVWQGLFGANRLFAAFSTNIAL